MPARLTLLALAAVVASLIASAGLAAAAEPEPSFDSLWESLAERQAARAYRAAREMIERGDEAAAFLDKKIPAKVRLSRRVPYDKSQDLQFHRAAYVLDCIGGKKAQKVRARITYTPAAAFRLYEEKPRADTLGDALPSGAVLRWGTDRFYLPQGQAAAVAISNGGKLAAVAPLGYYAVNRRFGYDNSAIKVYDLSTGLVKWQVPFVGTRASHMRFSRDGTRLIYSTTGQIGQIVVVDVARGNITNEISTGVANLTAFTLSEDEKIIYIGHADGTFAAYEFPGGKLIAQAQVDGAIATPPQRQRVARAIIRLHASPDFVSVDFNGTPAMESRLWEVRKNAWLHKKSWDDVTARHALAPDGKRYAVLKRGGAVEVRGVGDDKPQKEFSLNVQINISRTGRERFEFLDADRLLIADYANNSVVVSAETGKTIWSGRSTGYLTDIAASTDGRYLFSADGGRLRAIDLTTGRDLVEAFLAKLSDPYFTLSGDGETALAVRDNRLWQLDPSTLEPLGEIKLKGNPLALSYDGRFCAMQEPATDRENEASLPDGNARAGLTVCELASGTQLLSLEGHSGEANLRVTSRRRTMLNRVAGRAFPEVAASTVFHPNGRWLIFDGEPGTSSAVFDLWTGGRRADHCPLAAGERLYSPDGLSFLCLDQPNQVWTCCETVSGMPRWRASSAGFGYGYLPQWFAGGKFISFPGNAALDIREAKEGRVVETIASRHFDVRTCAVAPDGQSFATADGSRLRVYERCSKKLMFECATRGTAARFLAGGRFVEVADASGMTAICDVSSAATRRKGSESAAEQLARLWPALSGADAQEAFSASWAYAAAGNEAVDFLNRRLVKERELNGEQIQRLIAQLDNNRYEMRQAAYLQLSGMGRRIIPRLKAAADDPSSLELQLALERLIHLLESNEGPALLPRTAFVLRQIGTPEAEELLAELGEYSAARAFAPRPAPREP